MRNGKSKTAITPRRSNGTILPKPRTDRTPAPLRKVRTFTEDGPTTITLQRHPEDGRKFVKFVSSTEWQAGQVNGTVYIPKADAEDVTSVVVTINR